MTCYTNARPGASLLVVDLDLGTASGPTVPNSVQIADHSFGAVFTRLFVLDSLFQQRVESLAVKQFPAQYDSGYPLRVMNIHQGIAIEQY